MVARLINVLVKQANRMLSVIGCGFRPAALPQWDDNFQNGGHELSIFATFWKFSNFSSAIEIK